MIDCQYVGKIEENIKWVWVERHVADTRTCSALLEYGDELKIQVYEIK
jgi:hypothetical protein